jgi:sphingomyelin phosphodiesterase
MSAINRFAPDARFAIYNGDSIDHAVWSTTTSGVTDGIATVYALLAKLNMPVFGAIGNHDTSPVNSFPRRETTPQAAEWDWVYNSHARAWNMSKEAMVETSGSFAIRDEETGLRILSVNNNVGYRAVRQLLRSCLVKRD